MYGIYLSFWNSKKSKQNVHYHTEIQSSNSHTILKVACHYQNKYSKSNLENRNSERLEANRTIKNIKIHHRRAYVIVCSLPLFKWMLLGPDFSLEARSISICSTPNENRNGKKWSERDGLNPNQMLLFPKHLNSK